MSADIRCAHRSWMGCPQISQNPPGSQFKYLLAIPISVPGMPIACDDVQLLFAGQSLGQQATGFWWIEFVFRTPNDKRRHSNRSHATNRIGKEGGCPARQRKSTEWLEGLRPGQPRVHLRVRGNVQVSGKLEQRDLPVGSG